MNRQGDYASLARLAREKREQSEYMGELRKVLVHCLSAQQIIATGKPIERGPRQTIWAHIVDAIDLAEQELRRMGVEP